MTNSQIELEYIKLFHYRLEEVTRCNYYYKQQIHIFQESNQWLKKLKDLKELETPASPDEKEKHYLKIKELEIQVSSANELDKFLDRMADKSKRKLNEFDRKIEFSASGMALKE